MPKDRFMTKFLTLLASLLFFAGCGSSQSRQASSVLIPVVERVNAKLELTEPVTGNAEITVFQFLWFKFKSGDTGKMGDLTGQLALSHEYSVGNFLFGSPASKNDAVSAAKYNVINTGTNDAIIETKVHADNVGFSLLGILGWGKATAKIEGRGVVLKK
jgi:hypothetical protein